MSRKDYYSILGLNESATQQDIKRVYRDLAKKYHPDANPGDMDSEMRFKEISEAYDVLKDPEKRKKYDQLKRLGYTSRNDDWFSFDPHAFRRQTTWPFEGPGFSSSGNFSFGEILKEIFGFDNIENKNATFQKEPNVKKSQAADVSITFNESILGVAKFLKLSFNTQCEFCQGKGFRDDYLCSSCSGSGKIKAAKKIKVKIPNGVEDGHKLRISGLPFEQQSNGSTVDILVNIKVKPHKFFSRRGRDIFCEVPLDDEILEKGAKIRVSTIFGKKIDVQIPPGTAKGTLIRLPDLGIEVNGAKGDQFIKIT